MLTRRRKTFIKHSDAIVSAATQLERNLTGIDRIHRIKSVISNRLKTDRIKTYYRLLITYYPFILSIPY